MTNFESGYLRDSVYDGLSIHTTRSLHSLQRVDRNTVYCSSLKFSTR